VRTHGFHVNVLPRNVTVDVRGEALEPGILRLRWPACDRSNHPVPTRQTHSGSGFPQPARRERVNVGASAWVERRVTKSRQTYASRLPHSAPAIVRCAVCGVRTSDHGAVTSITVGRTGHTSPSPNAGRCLGFVDQAAKGTRPTPPEECQPSAPTSIVRVAGSRAPPPPITQNHLASQDELRSLL